MKHDEAYARLCDAIDKIPGIQVKETSCGHVTAPVCVWFDVVNPVGLMVLARAIDNRYGGPPRIDGERWFIKVGCIDVLPGYTYSIESSKWGTNACEWATKIADNIEDTLSRDNVRVHYDIGAAGTMKIWEEGVKISSA